MKVGRAILLLVLMSAAATGAFAAWDMSCRPRFRAVANGVEYARYTVSAVRYHALARVAVLRVDPAAARLGIVSFDCKRSHVRELVRSAGATAGVNGSYFDETGRPLGLTISNGKTLTPLRAVDWGVFYLDSSGAHLAHTREFSNAADVSFAIQCGPRLVLDGRPVKLKMQSSRRTAIGADAAGRVLLVVTTGQPMRMDEFARLLCAETVRGGLGCRWALNLDGGASSQMFLETEGAACDIPGADEVANAVVVFSAKNP